eukprot:scaffold7775_cov61-Cyclotella_meneghiniana.AAC.18
MIRQLQTLTLYGDLNMRPFRNAWMLKELQLPFKHIPCQPWSRTAKSVHPLGKIPALLVEHHHNAKESSFVIFESAAINTFLGDLISGNNKETCNINPNNHTLVPRVGTQERARYESLVSFVITELDTQSLWIHRKHSDLAHVFGEAPIAVNEAKRQFNNSLKVLEDELLGMNSNDGNYYLLPSCGFTAVDILFADCCSWANKIGWLVNNDDDRDVERELIFPGKEGKDKNETCAAISSVVISKKLEKYLDMCWSRPACKQAEQMRKNQKVMVRNNKQTSKL